VGTNPKDGGQFKPTARGASDGDTVGRLKKGVWTLQVQDRQYIQEIEYEWELIMGGSCTR